MSAFAQDHWFILDAAGNTVGEIMEDSALLGVIRRFVDFAAYFLPQKYTVRFGDQPVATIQQRRNPFTVKYDYAIDSGVFGNYRQLFLAISAIDSPTILDFSNILLPLIFIEEADIKVTPLSSSMI
jgi:hypothetical protein